MNRRLLPLVALLGLVLLPMQAQKKLTLTLDRAIQMANDSSLEAFRCQNLFLSGYWEFRAYRAERLPSISLDLKPAEYYRYIVERYDSENDMDVYREQQMFSAAGELNIRQNLDWTGGTFYIKSSLEYMRNFGATKYTQYSSVPLRIGYQQELLGYNPFRWQRRIEPLKYEKVKKEFLYNREQIAGRVVQLFFNLAIAQNDLRMAEADVASSDTLYQIGLKRKKIASISQSDLMVLELDKVNSRNSLKNATIALKRAMFTLVSFLNLGKDTEIELEIPSRPSDVEIPLEKALTQAKNNNPTYLEQKQSILEAEQNVDRTKREAAFNASVNASVGFNQVAESFGQAYKHPLQQQLVSMSVSIPLVDWGVRKGRYNMARNQLNVTRISARQEEQAVEEEVVMSVSDFNVQQDIISSAEEALDLAIMAYDQTKQRFMTGKADVNSLSMALSRQQNAQRNYLSALKTYWENFYKIRSLTLYDFASDFSLSDKMDFELHLY